MPGPAATVRWHSTRAAQEWLALAAGIALLAILTAQSLRDARSGIESRERARLEGRAELIAKVLAVRLSATGNALAELRDEAPGALAQPGGIARLDEQMRLMVASMVGVRTFVVVNRAGRLVASNRAALVGTEWAGKERYLTIRAHPDPALLFLSPPFLTPLGNWALSVGRVILDREGAFDGYVLAIIDPGFFDELLEAARYAPDMSVAMVHEGGLVIDQVPAAPGAVRTSLLDSPGSVLEKHLRGGKDRSTWIDVLPMTGKESLIVCQDIRPAGAPAHGFLVATLAREQEALLAPWRRDLALRVGLLAVVAAAAASALAFGQRRRAEAARKQAERDRTAHLAALGTLVAGVAHEVNNPLVAVTTAGQTAREIVRELREAGGFASPADRERIERLTAELEEMLSESVESAERIARIVKDLALLARPDGRRDRVDLGAIVRRSPALLPLAEAARVRVRVEVGPAPAVVAAPAQIEQVMANLLANAAHAIPDDREGEIVVRLAPGTPGSAIIEVSDDGCGIEPANRERIFEPFFTTRRQQQGTGLGLAICRAIVSAHGGTISVESQPGKGSTFRVELPAAPP